jgi:lipopolysaccharide transport system ATP-binding protein
MENVSQQGRTVLFVSHNMAAITRLCQRAILLNEGRVVQDDCSAKVVSAYLGYAAGSVGAVREWPDVSRSPGDDVVRLRAVRVRTENGEVADAVDIRKPVALEIEYDVLIPGKRLSPVIICINEEGICVFSSAGISPQFLDVQDIHFVGRRLSSCVIPGNLLAEGALTVTVSVNSIFDGNTAHAVERDAVRFQVVDSLDGSSARGLYGGPMAGVMRPLLTWTNKPIRTSSDSLTLSSDNGVAG